MSAPNSTTNTEQTTDHVLAPTDLFKVLANTRRRYALHYLTQHKEPVTLDALAAQLVQWEQDATKPLSGNHHARVAAALAHAHLPKLEDAGILRYDQAQKSIELRETVTVLQPHLDWSADVDLPPIA